LDQVSGQPGPLKNVYKYLFYIKGGLVMNMNDQDPLEDLDLHCHKEKFFDKKDAVYNFIKYTFIGIVAFFTALSMIN
jgi:hypothetical protein